MLNQQNLCTSFAPGPSGVRAGSFRQIKERRSADPKLNAAAAHEVRCCIIAEIPTALSNPKHGIICQQAAHLDQCFLILATSNSFQMHFKVHPY